MDQAGYRQLFTGNTLPGEDKVGTANDTQWVLPIVDSNVTDEKAENEEIVYSFTGDFIGIGSTFQSSHFRHMGVPFKELGTTGRCNRCRWFELRLFYDDSERRYVIHFAGRTIVPGEIQRFRMETALTAYEVIEVLSSRTSHGQKSRNDPDFVPHLTAPGLRALSQAAGFDDDIKEAFTARRIKL